MTDLAVKNEVGTVSDFPGTGKKKYSRKDPLFWSGSQTRFGNKVIANSDLPKK